MAGKHMPIPDRSHRLSMSAGPPAAETEMQKVEGMTPVGDDSEKSVSPIELNQIEV